MSWTHYDENNVVVYLQGRFDETGAPGESSIVHWCSTWSGNSYKDLWPLADDDGQVPFFTMKFYWQENNSYLYKNSENVLKDYVPITGLPNLDSHGFLDSNSYFRISWLRNLLYGDASGGDDLTTNLVDDDRWTETLFDPQGSWESFLNFWHTEYKNHWFCGYRAWGQSRASVTDTHYRDDEEDAEIVEVQIKKFLSPVSLKYDAENSLPSERNSDPAPYDHMHGSLTSLQEYKHFYPWLSFDVSSDSLDRDFRVNHFKINPGSYDDLHNDVRHRFQKTQYVEDASEAYMASKVDYFNTLLETTISTPKEFRVRTQASPAFDLNRLTTMPMSDSTSATSPTTTSTGGSSY